MYIFDLLAHNFFSHICTVWKWKLMPSIQQNARIFIFYFLRKNAGRVDIARKEYTSCASHVSLKERKNCTSHIRIF